MNGWSSSNKVVSLRKNLIIAIQQTTSYVLLKRNKPVTDDYKDEQLLRKRCIAKEIQNLVRSDLTSKQSSRVQRNLIQKIDNSITGTLYARIVIFWSPFQHQPGNTKKDASIIDFSVFVAAIKF